MTLQLVHALIMYAFPPLCGLAVGLLAQTWRLRWYQQGLAAALTVAFCLLIQYGGLLVMAGFGHGSWPHSATLAQWMYGLFWFAIPAIFLSTPGVLAGYCGGIALAMLRHQGQTTPLALKPGQGDSR